MKTIVEIVRVVGDDKLYMVSCVPFHKTVIGVSRVAQPLSTLTTEPRGGDTAMVDITVEGAVAPWVSRPVTVDPDGEVPKGKGMDDGTTTTSASATTVVANQFLCQLESERLEILEGASV